MKQSDSRRRNFWIFVNRNSVKIILLLGIVTMLCVGWGAFDPSNIHDAVFVDTYTFATTEYSTRFHPQYTRVTATTTRTITTKSTFQTATSGLTITPDHISLVKAGTSMYAMTIAFIFLFAWLGLAIMNTSPRRPKERGKRA